MISSAWATFYGRISSAWAFRGQPSLVVFRLQDWSEGVVLVPGSFYAPEDYPRTHPESLTRPAPHSQHGPVFTQAQPPPAHTGGSILETPSTALTSRPLALLA